MYLQQQYNQLIELAKQNRLDHKVKHFWSRDVFFSPPSFCSAPEPAELSLGGPSGPDVEKRLMPAGFPHRQTCDEWSVQAEMDSV